MEIKSEPKQYTEIPVTDIDIAFPGDLQTFTLRAEDTFVHCAGDNTALLTFASGGTIRFNLRHAHWVARLPRTIRVPTPEPSRVPE